jgi:hypothetical protein
MTIRFALAAALLAVTAPVVAQTKTEVAASHDRDLASIKAMAGTYKVTFDMRETVPFVAGYTPLPPKLSGGHEVVRVIAETPDYVALQHLLVVDMGDGKPMVIKHWRQDWTWQPRSVLVYDGPGQWTLQPVSDADRQGAWSQTVWQTDDSPRYGAIGRWRYDGGVARWMSAETRRPLARRDAVRKPPYTHYIGTNRHALTPTGWVHEQDNAKIGPKDGAEATFTHETVINSYVPATDFPVAAADTYWTKTSAYWQRVRADWDATIAKHKGVHVTEEADNGSAIGHELMLLADDVAGGTVPLDTAVKEASDLIAKEQSAAPAG